MLYQVFEYSSVLRRDFLSVRILYSGEAMNDFMLSELKKYIVPGSHAHLVGIGGVSMSPLAIVLHDAGINITGSDINEGDSVRALRDRGITVRIGHKAENIEGAEYIIRTAAARDDNVEIAAAREAGIPVFERAEAWGYIMRNYKNALCISGTHGKTTTTSMATHILMSAGVDPTVMIGGVLPMIKSGYRVGKGDTIVLESCEYYDSFLSFSPTVAVILNIEADHLDYFSDIEDIKKSFRKFASLVPEDTGCVIVNADDKNAMDAVSGLDRKIVTFGLSDNADITAMNIEQSDRRTSFDLIKNGEFFTHIEMGVPGKHNVYDALAASAGAILLGISPEAVAAGLASFTGAGRRFEFKGTYNGADVYDDYAHHPGELKALIDVVSSLDYKRVILSFQPHTYTRTKALFPDFVEQLSRVDVPILTEIYAAREKNTDGTTSRSIAEAIPGGQFCETLSELEDKLREIASPGDIILTVGAGDIYKVGDNLVK